MRGELGSAAAVSSCRKFPCRQRSPEAPAVLPAVPSMRSEIVRHCRLQPQLRLSFFCKLAKGAADDPKTCFRGIPSLFPQDRPKDRQAPQPGHIQFARASTAARARGSVFQAPRLNDLKCIAQTGRRETRCDCWKTAQDGLQAMSERRSESTPAPYRCGTADLRLAASSSFTSCDTLAASACTNRVIRMHPRPCSAGRWRP